MRIPRVYQAGNLKSGVTITLAPAASQHLVKVLRLKPGAAIVVFNGQGGEYAATISALHGQVCEVRLQQHAAKEVEPPLKIHLAQGIARGEKMDFIIQKVVELGISSITPLLSEFSEVRLNADRLAKRNLRWQRIMISACEQSGRNQIPVLYPAVSLQSWFKKSCLEKIQLMQDQTLGLVFHPKRAETLHQVCTKPSQVFCLLGPEGGLSATEVAQACEIGFKKASLGPRILRTETATIVALTALQCKWGDI